MEIRETGLDGVLLLEPEVFEDQRGFFKELYQEDRYLQAGISSGFVQDNYSRSFKYVLRGLHTQISRPQGKLVSCFRGVIFDVVVDINPKSKTFGSHIGVELSEHNHYQLWIPPGYAHGFCVLSDYADFSYKCTDFYDPGSESGILWSDPDLKIDWPVDCPIVSAKDQDLPSLREIRSGII